MSVHSSICGGGAVLSGVFHGKRKVRFLWKAAHVLFSPSLHPHLLHSSSHLLIIFSFSPPHLFLTFSLFHSLRHLLHPPPLSHPPLSALSQPWSGGHQEGGWGFCLQYDSTPLCLCLLAFNPLPSSLPPSFHPTLPPSLPLVHPPPTHTPFISKQ